ncbi:MAG: DNA-binding protein [Lachnospiraceae bacterium]|nr:DNA-binding protein [Lachnospiraceae bacterium]
MDDIVRKNMLYDFYGELLTDHQKVIYEDAVYNDCSLSELAAQYKISRQGVHDLLRRCDRILEGYEDKLHLVERFSVLKEKASLIEKMSDDEKVRELAREIIEYGI